MRAMEALWAAAIAARDRRFRLPDLRLPVASSAAASQTASLVHSGVSVLVFKVHRASPSAAVRRNL
jgi:hypothetical protein